MSTPASTLQQDWRWLWLPTLLPFLPRFCFDADSGIAVASREKIGKAGAWSERAIAYLAT